MLTRTKIFDDLGFEPGDLFSIRSLYYKNTYIGTTNTIFGGIRIHTRNKDVGYYTLEWCLGTRIDLIKPVVHILQHNIDNNTLHLLPKSSDIKPIYNDKEFIKHLETLGYTLQ